MMNFRLECDDDCFQLVLDVPGDTRVDIPVDYYSVSSLVAPDGRVIGAYMNGSEEELRALEADPDPENVSVISQSIQVYDLTKWPILTPIADAIITLQLTDLSDEDDEEAEDADIIEVKPV